MGPASTQFAFKLEYLRQLYIDVAGTRKGEMVVYIVEEH